jgi:hypothetical protein
MRLPEPLWSRVLEVRDVLAFSFDFEPFECALGSEAYATPAPWLPAFVVPSATVAVLARDATGGAYAHCEQGQTSYCLHIDPRGHAVPLGESVPQALALILALPYWLELLAQCPPRPCPSDELVALRELARRLEREVCEDFPDLPAARLELLAFLQLPAHADAVLRLYELAVAQPPPTTVWSPHGWRYESPIQRSGREHALR